MDYFLVHVHLDIQNIMLSFGVIYYLQATVNTVINLLVP